MKRRYLKNPMAAGTPPIVGAMCIVLVDDKEVPLRTAYWCDGVWRNPHTAMPLVPAVKKYCTMETAISVLLGYDEGGAA